MGMTKSESACPYDGVCWATGKTPKYIVCTVQGIEKEYPNPDQPEPANGMFNLLQIDSTHWQGYRNGWTYTLHLDNYQSQLAAKHDSGWIGFSVTIAEPCTYIFVQTVPGFYYIGGIAVLGWFGPDGSEDSIRETIESIGFAAPDKVQVEMYGTSAGKQVKRFANEYDGTRVYIKN